MTDAGLRAEGALDAQPRMGVRNLHNFGYCPRLFYLQWVENIFQENADTVAGSLAHRSVDVPSKYVAAEADLPEGATRRSLRVESESLGLVGVVDLLEGGEGGPEIIEFKKGSARRGPDGERRAKEPDALQVAAYALLLREQGVHVVHGAVYYAADKRRVPVPLDGEIFDKVRATLAEARAVAAGGRCPPPLKNDARCLYCSAYPICLPNESLWWARRRSSTEGEGQLHFGFAENSVDGGPGSFEALDFAAESVLRKDPVLEPPRPPGDDSEVLVVQTPGAQVGQRGDQLVVSVKGEESRKIPGQQVRAIYCFGAVQITAQAVETCLELGIDISYFSPAGRFLGLLRGLPASGVDARRGQYRLFDLPELRLKVAREVIRAKIHNQRVMLMRNGNVDDGVLKALTVLRDGVDSAADMTVLLGIEGRAAALYFERFDLMLKRRDDWKFDWKGRNRRPPRDPVNALLSLGYSMLAKELTGVCHTVGLDPFLGFMHQPRYGRPALALDLMEEFRPLIADSVTISLINRGELGPEDFMRNAAGTFLTEGGRRAFWEAWFRRLDTEVSHPEFSYKMSYRRMLEVQARQLWRFVRGEALSYHGFVTR